MLFSDHEVKNKFESYPEPHRSALLKVRNCIFETGSKLTLFGEVEESLKWNQPSYVILGRRIGTSVRVDLYDENKIALYVSSNTSLIQQFKKRFGKQFDYHKNRAIILNVHNELPLDAITICVDMAFTYHLNKSNF